MAVWKIYNTTSGKIAVVSPYHDLIVQAAKKRMGSFKSLTVDGKSLPAWFLDPSHREAMEQECRDLFEVPLIERVVSWTAKDGYSMNIPTMDGYALVYFGRDSYSFKRFERGEPFAILEILEDGLDTGGSRNNPKLFGHCKLKVRCRAAAEANGHDWIVEVES